MRSARSWDPWSEAERVRFMLDRAQLLHTLLSDRQSWHRTAAQQGGEVTLSWSWTDHTGQIQTQPLTPEFLTAHARIVRAVAFDLIDCGADGQRLAEHLFATLSRSTRRLEA